MLRGSTVNVSTINVERVNSQCREGQQSMWRGSTVNFHFHVKRQLSLLILGGGGSMINMERINSQLSLSHEKAITSVDPGGRGRSMIDAERINS